MSSNFHKIKYFFKNKQKGMTLVELLVVLSIFTILTGVVMYDYSSFRSATSTQNLADDIALSIRKAQSYAIGVRGLNSVFDYGGHGIHFTTTNSTNNILSGYEKSFIIFSDINKDRNYDYPPSGVCGSPASGNECEEILSINSADKILYIYLNGSSTPQVDGGVLDILFERPDPDAKFCYRVTPSSSCTSSVSSVKIKISNGQTGNRQITKTITIWNTGQIGFE